MRFSTLLSALFIGVALLPCCAFAGDLAGTRLACSGTQYNRGEPYDVSGRIIELQNDGEAYVEGVDNCGRMHYDSFDTQVNLDWPSGCMATNMSKCQYYGIIKRSGGATNIVDNRTNRAVFIGQCVPFKPVF